MGNCLANSGDDTKMKIKTPTSTTYKQQHNTNSSASASASASADDGGKVDREERIRRVVIGGEIVSQNLKMFTLEELKSATRNFRPDTMVGEGGFGRVFKGWIDQNSWRPSKVGVGIPVAVKKSSPDSVQGLQEWQSEVKFLGTFSHPNLVKLLGYCWEEDQFLLVYEYMQKGSLESHLFRKGPEALSWDIRLKIAIGAARGLAFLHTSEKSVIYRDFKSSNILLDGDFNSKLSDFGLAKFGPVCGKSHVTTRVMGTYGYAAPEYMATGHLYVKSDVYGFGVVLLEMLTGLIALDPNRSTDKVKLVDFTIGCLSDRKKLKTIMDQRMNEQYSLTAALQISHLILKCLESDPKNRPSMEQVLETLEKAQTIKYKPKVKKSRSAVHQKDKRSMDHPHNNGHSKLQTHSSH